MNTKKATGLFFLCLIISCCFIYSNSVFYAFTNWDDYVQVVDNPYIKQFNFTSLKGIFSTFFVGMYQPITTSFYAIIYQFSSLNPIGYHAGSLVFHLLNTLLVYQLISFFFNEKKIIFFLTSLFALHPLQVESVAWVSAFSNLVFSSFFLLSIIAYLNYLNKKRKAFYFLSLLVFSTGLSIQISSSCTSNHSITY